ncbi:endospore germination permease [Faecalispora jeddahensis]|uniref:GerAB/ArcD/ProY family transporter n=1 Tax=Faecalispora jeddahensis TaxID=1414721 RepID=UPI00145B63F5|nr:endospore germination permease [Faecalispora jeddahensis]
MNQERITNHQLFSMVVLFVIGSSLIVGVAAQVEIDKWIAILIALAAAVPTLMVYIKLLSLFPGKNLFDILFLVFGKWVGRLFVLLYTWYAFHLGAMVLRNFGEFVNMMAMPETPMIMPILLMGVSCIWIVKEGIEVLGRSAFFLLPIIVAIIFIVQLLCIPQLNLQFLTPILADGWEPVLEGAFSTFSFPFAETVLFAAVLCCPANKKAPYKPFLGGLIAGAFIILTVTFRNLMVMGATLKQSPYFPSYIAVGRIRIGDFLQRMEITVSIVFVVGAFIKISICLLAASTGVKKLAGLNHFRSVVMPIGILMILLANGIYKNTIEMVKWAFDIYSYYALPFQLFIPLVLLGIALISKHKKKKANEQPSS